MRTKLDAFIVGGGFLASIILLAGWLVKTGHEQQVVHAIAQQASIRAPSASEVGPKAAGTPREIVEIQRVTWGVGGTHVDVTQRVKDLMERRGWFIPCKEDLQSDPKTARSKTLIIEYTINGRPALLKTHAWAYVNTDWLIKNANHETPGSAFQPVSNIKPSE